MARAAGVQWCAAMGSVARCGRSLPWRHVRGSIANASTTVSKRAPPGYYGPRLAVGAASIVGSVAVYELISRALPHTTDDALSEEWDSEWDTHARDATTASVDTSCPGAAILAASDQLRSMADNSVGRRHIILVRHAQPVKNENDAAELSPQGWKQAELTGQRLLTLFGKIDRVYHSGAREASATAAAIKRCFGDENCPITESALLAEGLPVLPSPLPVALGEVSDDELMLDASRAEGAFRALMWRPTGARPQRVTVDVVVSHGNLVRYLVCRGLQLPEVAWSRLAAHHCTITWLDIDDGGVVSLREFGSVGHLPPELITYQ